MMDWRDLKAHPAAAVLPMMSPAERKELVASIATNGYDPNEPITVLDSLIVDGRNRHSVCLELNVEPATVQFDGDPGDVGRFILNRNAKTWRRLNQVQKAIVHLKMAPWLKSALVAKSRETQKANLTPGGPGRGHKNREPQVEALDLPEGKKTNKVWATAAAKEADVSRGTMERGAFVEERDPELAGQVVSGEVKMLDALARLGWVDNANGMPPDPKKKRKKKEPRPQRPHELELAELETRIEARMEAFVDVAYMLLEIRDRHLFSSTHGQFFAYMADRWGLSFKDDGPAVMCAMDAVEFIKKGELR